MNKVLALAIAVLLPAPAWAQQLVSVTGSCHKLVLAKNTFTPFCKGIAINSAYSDGRVGFTFMIADKAVVTFSGVDMKNPSADTDRTNLDMLIFNLGIDGVPPSKTKVKGTCNYGNPYKGRMVIDCKATGQDGKKYSVRFQTDGNPPRS